jgi:glycosyltransferase involved in cell wall biosynthesis
MISIIVPYYKTQKYIFKSINSVLIQTYKNWEILIVDNEVSKESKIVLNKIQHLSKRIKVYQNFNNNYVGLARNLGIIKSRGKLISFLDCDDFWHKKKLQYQLADMRNRNLDLSFTNFKAVNFMNKVLYSVKSPNSFNFNDIIKACPFSCSSVMIKKKILINNKFKKMTTKEDYDLWLRLAKKNIKMGTCQKFLTFYLVRSGSLSSNYLNKLYNAFIIYYKTLNFNLFYALYSLLRLYFNAFKKKYL